MKNLLLLVYLVSMLLSFNFIFKGENACLNNGQPKYLVKEEIGNQKVLKTTNPINIKSAIWAAGDKAVVVTNKVQTFANNNINRFEVRNHTLRADPALGKRKTLTVVYVKNGKEITKSCTERGFFSF